MITRAKVFLWIVSLALAFDADTAVAQPAPTISPIGTNTDDCLPQFVDPIRTVSINSIRVGLRENARESFSIRVRNEGIGPCSTFLRVAQRNTLAIAQPIEFRLRSLGRDVQILPNESTPGVSGSDLFLAGIPSGSNGRAIPFLFGFPTNWGMEAGRFSQEFVFTLHNQAGTELDRMILAAQITIPQAVSLRIVGATGNGRARRVDLGDLSSDRITQSEPFGLRVWSTSPYRVEFRSDNLGELRRIGADDTVPYTLRMNGAGINLRGANLQEFPSGTDAFGDFHPLRVIVEPVFARAGSYSDRVSVTVSVI